ncbi:unnamed protein product [Closterium sp. NIES-54]
MAVLLVLEHERAATTAKPRTSWQAEKLSTVHARTAIALDFSLALVGLYTYCISFLLIQNIASNFPEYTASVAASVDGVSLPVPANPSHVPKQSSSAEKGFTQSVSPPPTNPAIDPPTEPPTKPSSEPPTNTPTKPPTKPPTSPPTNPPTKPPVNHPTEPPTKPPTEPPTRPPTKSPAKPPTEPAIEPPTEPSSKPPTETPAKPLSNPPLSKPDPSLWTRIPGSVLDSPEKIRSF